MTVEIEGAINSLTAAVLTQAIIEYQQRHGCSFAEAEEAVLDQHDHVQDRLIGVTPAQGGEEIDVIISGYSDDIVSIEGDISDELYVYNTPATLSIGPFSIVVEYDGDWHFSVDEAPEGATYEHYNLGEYTDSRDYSEAVSVRAPSGSEPRLE